MPSTARSRRLVVGVRAIERQQLGVVVVQDRHDLQGMTFAGAHHPMQQQQRLGGVAAIDGIGEVPRRHSPGLAEERFDIDDLQDPRVAVCRRERFEDALHPAGVFSEPRRQQAEGLLVEPQTRRR